MDRFDGVELDRKSAFTLIELLVVVAVLGALMTFGYSVSKRAIASAYTSQELTAGRALVAAYASAAAENDGKLLLGYDESANGMRMPNGAWVSPGAAHRYPYRLAPYLDYAIDGTILLTRNRAQLAQINMPDKEYAASLYPAFGMNISFVGGEYRGGDSGETRENECATRMSQVTMPSSLLVFASAARKNGEQTIDGFFELVPPNKRVTLWSGSDTVQKDNLSPESYGNLAFRHDGLAVCAFLDGSVRMMGPAELRDMRLWSKNAQAEDNPGYTIPIEGPPPGRGGGR